ncbi:MAG: homocysteine S-methyltransferase family protein [Candidatus Omnitrophica bacterium]|nr:homocysteine S-methyltransferase family protein [Candidatus Omnitrophota bacterium]
MATLKRLTEIAKKRPIMLDGATGTELQKAGLPQGVSPELWCTQHPEVIRGIHAAYTDAGADIIYTCTFGANAAKLSQYQHTGARELNKKLALLAREAAGEGVLIAGDIGPTGYFVEPFGTLTVEEAVAIFKEQATGLLEGGVDLLVIETMMDIQEARAALIAAKEIGDIYTIVTMTYEERGRTLNGTDPVTALITLQGLGADAVGCNCSTGPDDMQAFIAAMKPFSKVPLVAKPNAGMPHTVDGRTVFNMGPEEFASFGRGLVKSGADMIGGCCGSTPGHIRTLSRALEKERPLTPPSEPVSAVTSTRRAVFLDRKKRLIVVGERINPTGKSRLAQELSEGSMVYLKQLAREQASQGADLLDINVGAAHIDEKKTIEQVIYSLAPFTECPLVIDSSNASVIERALRLYPGRALINSVSGETEKLERLLPVMARYGAMAILLPIGDGGVPETAQERKDIVCSVLQKAKSYGLDISDFVIDGLTLSVSSNPQSVAHTLEVIHWSSSRLKAHTIIGLSNVSFGLPGRRWINAAFLEMARDKGLSIVIADPSHITGPAPPAEEASYLDLARAVLVGRDRNAARFIAHFSSAKESPKKETGTEALSPSETLHSAILNGDKEIVAGIITGALRCGYVPAALVDDVIIPGILEVGDLFDKKAYFLPQLIASAEATKEAFSVLAPYLEKEGDAKRDRGTILIATVKGDIHDIGKNIVALMLRNHRFNVIDLGKDVSSEAIIAGIKRHKPAIVGLSALMTTTMTGMKDVIDLVENEGLECKFIVGGAVVTSSYARSIGAAYAKDSVEAVRVTEQLIKKE